MDAGCECVPGVRSANPSDSWARLLRIVFTRTVLPKEVVNKVDLCSSIGFP